LHSYFRQLQRSHQHGPNCKPLRARASALPLYHDAPPPPPPLELPPELEEEEEEEGLL